MIYQYLKRFYQQENDHQEIAHYMSKGEIIFSVAFSHNIIVIIHTHTPYTAEAKLSDTSVGGAIEKPAIGMHVQCHTGIVGSCTML